jgi:hypothetical protein
MYLLRFHLDLRALSFSFPLALSLSPSLFLSLLVVSPAGPDPRLQLPILTTNDPLRPPTLHDQRLFTTFSPWTPTRFLFSCLYLVSRLVSALPSSPRCRLDRFVFLCSSFSWSAGICISTPRAFGFMPSDSVSPLRMTCAADLPNDLRASSIPRRLGSGTHLHPPFTQKNPTFLRPFRLPAWPMLKWRTKSSTPSPSPSRLLASSPCCTLLDPPIQSTPFDALRLPSTSSDCLDSPRYPLDCLDCLAFRRHAPLLLDYLDCQAYAAPAPSGRRRPPSPLLACPTSFQLQASATPGLTEQTCHDIRGKKERVKKIERLGKTGTGLSR